MKLILAAVAAALLTGCATPRVVALPDTFDAAQTNAMLVPGKNSIKGSALIRQNGGGIVTCAGLEVHLVPATSYAASRMTAIYGSQNFTTQPVKFEPEPPGYKQASKVTRCNAQGFFAFDEVADGDFFLTTVVLWTVNYAMQGGALMGRVAVSGGQSKEVVLTR